MGKRYEGTMEEKESEVTKAVREAVVKAVEKGEDIKEKVVEITRDAVKKALEGAEVTREKVESVAKGAMKGAIEGHGRLKWRLLMSPEVLLKV